MFYPFIYFLDTVSGNKNLMTDSTKPQMTSLITGATDGIGLALAHHYRRQGHRLILIGRRPYPEVPLSDFPADLYCQTDLSQENCPDTIADFLAQRQINSLDLLIHNAGVGYYGPITDQSAQNINDLIMVNLWTPIALTQRLLPLMSQAQAKIVFISSVTSVLPTPEYAVYGASKAALDGFARNLRIELGNCPQIQLIHPGGTRTGMHPKSGLQRTIIDWERFPSAETVASQIAQAIASNKRAVTIGTTNKLLRLGGRYLGGLFETVLRRRYRRGGV